MSHNIQIPVAEPCFATRRRAAMEHSAPQWPHSAW